MPRSATGRDAGDRRPGVVSALVFTVSLAACDAPREPVRVLALETHLRQQIADLESLVARAEKGALVPTDGLVVAVHEDVVRQVAQLALPREQVVGGRFRVRLETADVRLRDKHGAIRLGGRVSRAGDDFFDADIEAELAVFARLEAVAFDRTSGMLSGRVMPIGFELQKLGVAGERPLLRRLVAGFARLQEHVLAELAFPLTIPVGFESELRLAGREEGPVRIRPASCPVKVTVRDAAAHGGRLWIVLGIEAGPWTRAAPSGGRR